ncbi:trehalose-6-phosphate synthase6 [Zea mays]|uniref:Trehalose-6-phosphate synthase6 n=1 Tax=Zea mays TaxID=4577 RepID=A0A1D6NC94_MAIZE|nr:trehalose-6-phosphate synthase6 [Zea mays]ONM38149.1 trehalose-6-phosphate synthase6 [Zea mays]
MMSRSYTNLLDLAEGNFAALGPVGGSGRQRHGSFGLRRMSRVMTVPGTLTELDGEDESEPAATSSVASDVPSSVAADRLIVVSNQLPIVARRRPDGRGWSFSWDDDSLLLQLRDGIPDEMEVLFVGSLRADVPAAEQDAVSQALLDRFRCAPVFLPDHLNDRFYHGFCKRQLWPLFHYMLPFSSPASASAAATSSSVATSSPGNGCFDRSAWEAYVLANKFFFEKVVEVINPEDDYVWVHDYHLLALPTFLRRRFNRLRIGFFLHSPFPSSEIYRTLPVRDEILKALLNCDLIGFHTFDYARHFLSCCSRMLGIEYQSKRGYIGLDYFGRTVGIKIMPVGVHMGQLESGLRLPDREWRLSELQQQFQGKTVLLGVDDMDIFKGINLKLLAFENMLRTHPKWQGRAVLVQIANPARGRGKDLEAIQAEIEQSCQRINVDFGQSGYSPVVFINRDVSSVEKVAYYTIAECVVVTAVRDGMNLTPYEYIVCRQGAPGSESVSEVSGPKKSMLVVSEFIGCSPSLSGAIRVNPWNIEATAEAMNEAISMPEQEKQLRHEKHYRYVSSHDVAYWSKSFILDLERACRDHFKRTCWGIGLGFGFRVVALDPHFRKLNMDSIVNAYEISESRAILLDYDGTLVPQTSINKEPSPEVLNIINTLCSDSRNIVFLVSGRDKDTLGKWFSSCPKLGIAAEHGYILSGKGVSKGIVAERILASVKERGKQADFVLCIGDDRSDEDMFENIADIIKRNMVAPRTSLFACTVGQKPSKAKFYLDDTFEVVAMLSALADATGAELKSDSADELAASISSLDIGDEQSESSDTPIGGS